MIWVLVNLFLSMNKIVTLNCVLRLLRLSFEFPPEFVSCSEKSLMNKKNRGNWDRSKNFLTALKQPLQPGYLLTNHFFITGGNPPLKV